MNGVLNRKTAVLAILLVMFAVFGAIQVSAAVPGEPWDISAYAVNDGSFNGLAVLSESPVHVNGTLITETRDLAGKVYYFYPTEGGTFRLTNSTGDVDVEVSFRGPGETYSDSASGYTWTANTEEYGSLGVVKYLTALPMGDYGFTVVGWGFDTNAYPDGYMLWDYGIEDWYVGDSWGYLNATIVIQPTEPPIEEEYCPDNTDPITPLVYALPEHGMIGINSRVWVDDVLLPEQTLRWERKDLYAHVAQEGVSYHLVGCGGEYSYTVDFLAFGDVYEDENISVVSGQEDWAKTGVIRLDNLLSGKTVYTIVGKGFDFEWPWPPSIRWWADDSQSWVGESVRVWGVYNIISVDGPEGPIDPPDDPTEPAFQIFMPALFKQTGTTYQEAQCLELVPQVPYVWHVEEGLAVCSREIPQLAGFQAQPVLNSRYNWVFEGVLGGTSTVTADGTALTVRHDLVPFGRTFFGDYMEVTPRSTTIGVVQYPNQDGKYQYAIWGFDFGFTPGEWGWSREYWKPPSWVSDPFYGEFSVIRITP